MCENCKNPNCDEQLREASYIAKDKPPVTPFAVALQKFEDIETTDEANVEWLLKRSNEELEALALLMGVPFLYLLQKVEREREIRRLKEGFGPFLP